MTDDIYRKAEDDARRDEEAWRRSDTALYIAVGIVMAFLSLALFALIEGWRP